LAWDEALVPEPWFEAATIHLYPDMQRLQAQPGGNDAFGLWKLLMGRMDAGIDRTISDIAARLPGKEIWITEWAPQSGLVADSQGTLRDLISPDMAAHIVTRAELSILRHPEITRALFFDLSFNLETPFQAYVLSDGAWLPLPSTAVLAWFHQAANNGAIYQRIVEQGGVPIATGSDFQETYMAIEGGEFLSESTRTLILQNASGEDRLLDTTFSGTRGIPSAMDLIQISNWYDMTKSAAQIQHVPVSTSVQVPAYGLVRIIWHEDSP